MRRVVGSQSLLLKAEQSILREEEKKEATAHSGREGKTPTGKPDKVPSPESQGVPKAWQNSLPWVLSGILKIYTFFLFLLMSIVLLATQNPTWKTLTKIINRQERKRWGYRWQRASKAGLALHRWRVLRRASSEMWELKAHELPFCSASVEWRENTVTKLARDISVVFTVF